MSGSAPWTGDFVGRVLAGLGLGRLISRLTRREDRQGPEVRPARRLGDGRRRRRRRPHPGGRGLPGHVATCSAVNVGLGVIRGSP
ncbi:hypothetical protein QJS66_07460 [Kocuria rhizophila]|nr:hypothetical protein QJS66_07460 [Kocuria rhizophila]